jgi:tetratricopeptide (TPR) repeat protein
MLNHTLVARTLGCAVLAASCASASAFYGQAAGAPDKVPVTTASADARRLYLQGRDLAEKLRITDARRLYSEAVASDGTFALAYLGLANTAGTTKEFIDATTRAAALAGGVSEGERQIILAVEAGMKGNPAGVLAHYNELVRLFPNDPNPSDSYAELLMKIGRFDESIDMYQKALSIDPNFVASYVGIGNNHLCGGRPDEARAAFAKLADVARNTGERRLAHLWIAASHVHDGATDKALAELKAEYALAEAEKDAGSMSGDLTQMGDVLREAGRYDEALARYAESVAVIDTAQVPPLLRSGTPGTCRARQQWRPVRRSSTASASTTATSG